MSTDYHNAHLKLFLSKIEKAKTSIVPIKTQSADYEICEESVLGNNISINRERSAFPICLSLVTYRMVIQILSSRSRAAVMALMRRLSQIREFTTMPSNLFSPTRMQPCVSSG